MDITTWKMRQAVERLKDGDQTLFHPELPAVRPTISPEAVRQSENALNIMLADRRRKNIENRMQYEERAWSLIMKLLDSLDELEKENLFDLFGGQQATRSVKAIEGLTRTFNTLLKNLSIEANEVVPGDPLAALPDEQLDNMLDRAIERNPRVIYED